MREELPIYPSDPALVALSADRWNAFHGSHDEAGKHRPPFPKEELLRKLFDVIYHVSFMTEESHRLAVRLAFLTPADCDADTLNLHNPPVTLSRPRPCTPAEIMKLAPALDPSQSMIAIAPSESVGLVNSENSLAIWGLLHVGEDWSRPTAGRITAARTPPSCLTLSSLSPGMITLSTAGTILVRMGGGRLIDAPLRGFDQGQIGKFLRSGAEKLYQEVLEKLHATNFSTRPEENGVPLRMFYHVFENLVRFAAAHHRGATFVVVADDGAALKRTEELVALKYPIRSPEIWPELVNECVAYRRYFDLLTPDHGTNIFERQTASAADFKTLERWRIAQESAETKMLEFEQFVASLSCVDGAVVLTTGLEILGFGGEIVPASSKLKTVREAQSAGVTRDIDSYGTRHRSAFRLCDNLEDCVVFVVSQDGDARAVKKVGPDVLLWDHILLRGYG